MKKLPLAILFLTVSLGGLTADELIQNGDFSQGSASWRGDAQTDDAPSDPLATAPAKAGLVVKLNDASWVKVYQDFTGNSDKLTIKVEYQLSADAAFSTDEKAYKNITHSIGYDGWKPFHLAVGTWCMMLSDFGPDKGRY